MALRLALGMPVKRQSKHQVIEENFHVCMLDSRFTQSLRLKWGIWSTSELVAPFAGLCPITDQPIRRRLVADDGAVILSGGF